jgi:hypothetical protein
MKRRKSRIILFHLQTYASHDDGHHDCVVQDDIVVMVAIVIMIVVDQHSNIYAARS